MLRPNRALVGRCHAKQAEVLATLKNLERSKAAAEIALEIARAVLAIASVLMLVARFLRRHGRVVIAGASSFWTAWPVYVALVWVERKFQFGLALSFAAGCVLTALLAQSAATPIPIRANHRPLDRASAAEARSNNAEKKCCLVSGTRACANVRLGSINCDHAPCDEHDEQNDASVSAP